MANVFYFRGEVSYNQELYFIKGTYYPGSDLNYWDDSSGPQITLQEVKQWDSKQETYLAPIDIEESFQFGLEKAALEQEVYLQDQSI